MTSCLSRVLFAGFLAACAHGPQTSAGASEPIAQPAGSLPQLLVGRVSGAIVQELPGGGISVRISGPKSFSLSQEPLYVVDGVPVTPGANGALSWLNVADIELIKVLKYEADTAIYGVRGANGVVIIKTKGAH
jgi:TonB-dependent SusC/RagA subfamily outer membrane receptor